MSFLSISFGGLLLHSHEYKSYNSGITLDEFHHISQETCIKCEFLKNTHYNIFFESHSTLETTLTNNFTFFQSKDCYHINRIQLVGRAPPANLI